MGVVELLERVKVVEYEKGDWSEEAYGQIDKLIKIIEGDLPIVITNEEYYIYKEGESFPGLCGDVYELDLGVFGRSLDDFMEEWTIPVDDGYCMDIWLI